MAIPPPRCRKGPRTPNNPLKSRGRRTSDRVLGSQKDKAALIPNKGKLEAFGFFARGPRHEYLAQADEGGRSKIV